jgi:predicted metal-binding transcription factor (methanogenesis marker protein 9)
VWCGGNKYTVAETPLQKGGQKITIAFVSQKVRPCPLVSATDILHIARLFDCILHSESSVIKQQ